jgi:hypothetical protein
VVLFVSFEMLGKFSDTAAQQRDLYFRRTGVGFMNLVVDDDLPLCFTRQCHLRVATPCLLFSRFVSTPV